MATTKKFLDITGLGKFLDKLKTIFALKSHSHSSFKGATDDSAGTSGYVPAPAAGDNTKVLYGDGTWRDVEELCTVSNIEASTDGTAYGVVTVQAETDYIPIGSTVSVSNELDIDSMQTWKWVITCSNGSFGDLNAVLLDGDSFGDGYEFMIKFPKSVTIRFRIDSQTTTIGNTECYIGKIISVAPKSLYRKGQYGNLVPESSSADLKKFLQGDGKWTTPESDQVLYQSSGTDTVKDKIAASDANFLLLNWLRSDKTRTSPNQQGYGFYEVYKSDSSAAGWPANEVRGFVVGFTSTDNDVYYQLFLGWSGSVHYRIWINGQDYGTWRRFTLS